MNMHNQDGIFLGGHTLATRETFIKRKIEEYDRHNPGNTQSAKMKRHYARNKWRNFVLARLERDRKLFEALV